MRAGGLMLHSTIQQPGSALQVLIQDSLADPAISNLIPRVLCSRSFMNYHLPVQPATTTIISTSLQKAARQTASGATEQMTGKLQNSIIIILLLSLTENMLMFRVTNVTSLSRMGQTGLLSIKLKISHAKPAIYNIDRIDLFTLCRTGPPAR